MTSNELRGKPGRSRVVPYSFYYFAVLVYSCVNHNGIQTYQLSDKRGLVSLYTYGERKRDFEARLAQRTGVINSPGVEYGCILLT